MRIFDPCFRCYSH